MAVKKSPHARGKGYGGANRQGQRNIKTSAVRSSTARPAKSAKKSRMFSTSSPKKRQATIIDTIGSMSFTTKIIISIAVAVTAVICLVSLTKSQLTINEKQKVLDDLDTQIAQQQLENDELKDRINGDLDQYIEAYARENLDIVKPGERVYINTVGD